MGMVGWGNLHIFSIKIMGSAVVLNRGERAINCLTCGGEVGVKTSQCS